MNNNSDHLFVNQHHDNEEHWVSVSDLMSALMLIFLLIAILFMIKVDAEKESIEDEKNIIEREKQKIEEIATTYRTLRIDLYNDLHEEFKDDLIKWNAELRRDLSIRFKEPDVLFDTGQSTIKEKFKIILDSFFPRYIMILSGGKYINDISEIRIEGHTSSIWSDSVSEDEAYIHNMKLSQERTRSVLAYVLNVDELRKEKDWIKKRLTANGLSSSRLILVNNGHEDREKSRRVEFRVMTDADTRIEKILETMKF